MEAGSVSVGADGGSSAMPAPAEASSQAISPVGGEFSQPSFSPAPVGDSLSGYTPFHSAGSAPAQSNNPIEPQSIPASNALQFDSGREFNLRQNLNQQAASDIIGTDQGPISGKKDDATNDGASLEDTGNSNQESSSSHNIPKGATGALAQLANNLDQEERERQERAGRESISTGASNQETGNPGSGVDNGIPAGATGALALANQETDSPASGLDNGIPAGATGALASVNQETDSPASGLDNGIPAGATGALALANQENNNPASGLDNGIPAGATGALALFNQETDSPASGLDNGIPAGATGALALANQENNNPASGLDNGIPAGATGALALFNQETGNPGSGVDNGIPAGATGALALANQETDSPASGLDNGIPAGATGALALFNQETGNTGSGIDNGIPAGATGALALANQETDNTGSGADNGIPPGATGALALSNQETDSPASGLDNGIPAGATGALASANQENGSKLDENGIPVGATGALALLQDTLNSENSQLANTDVTGPGSTEGTFLNGDGTTPQIAVVDALFGQIDPGAPGANHGSIVKDVLETQLGADGDAIEVDEFTPSNGDTAPLQQVLDRARDEGKRYDFVNLSITPSALFQTIGGQDPHGPLGELNPIAQLFNRQNGLVGTDQELKDFNDLNDQQLKDLAQFAQDFAGGRIELNEEAQAYLDELGIAPATAYITQVGNFIRDGRELINQGTVIAIAGGNNPNEINPIGLLRFFNNDGPGRAIVVGATNDDVLHSDQVIEAAEIDTTQLPEFSSTKNIDLFAPGLFNSTHLGEQGVDVKGSSVAAPEIIAQLIKQMLDTSDQGSRLGQNIPSQQQKEVLGA